MNHSLIEASLPPGTRVIRNSGTVRFDNPERELAWARQYSLGYEHQVGSTIGLSVDYIRTEQRNQYILMELNPGVRNSGLATGTVTRTNPLVGSGRRMGRAACMTLNNDGWINYNTIQVSGTKRYANRWQGRLSYAYSRGEGNTPRWPGGSGGRRRNSSMICGSTTKSARPTSIGRTF